VAGAIFQKKDQLWICTQAAPIISYLVGWNATRAMSYFEAKGFGLEWL
jgi:hypothetical protein